MLGVLTLRDRGWAQISAVIEEKGAEPTSSHLTSFSGWLKGKPVDNWSLQRAFTESNWGSEYSLFPMEVQLSGRMSQVGFIWLSFL